MKKHLFLLLSLLFAVSCSDYIQDQHFETDYGSIVLKTELDTDTEPTRGTSTDYTTYTILLTDAEGVLTKMPYPNGNVISSLKSGQYTVGLTSHPEGFNKPAFDEQVYEGSTDILVKPGETVQADITCIQTNAGVFFVYGEGLQQAGLVNIIPTVSQDAGQLIYKDEDREQTGYFLTGTAVLTLECDGETVPIKGEEQMDLTLEKKQLWRITLDAVPDGEGGIRLSVEVDVTVDEKNMDIILTPPAKTEGMQILGLEGGTISVELSNGTTYGMSLDSKGTAVFEPHFIETHKGTVITSVTPEGGSKIYIGRLLGETFSFAVDSGISVLREADTDGKVPVSIIHEIMLIETDAATVAKSYKQEGNLDFVGLTWTAICKATNFSGIYDGQDFEIANLTIDDETDYAALFGRNNGIIQNVNVVSGNISGGRYVSAVCANNAVAASRVINCTNAADVTGKQYVSGICAYNQNAQSVVEYCENTGNISNREPSGTRFAGITAQSAGIIRNCVNRGNITAADDYAAGICARTAAYAHIEWCKNYGEISSTSGYAAGICSYIGRTNIYDCENHGNVTVTLAADGSSRYIGGVGGYAANSGYGIERCLNTGNITSNANETGGIIGGNTTGRIKDNVNSGNVAGLYTTGGIVGEQLDGQFSGNRNSGTITGTERVGGLIGRVSSDQLITNSINTGNVTGVYMVGGNIGVMVADMEDCSNSGVVTGIQNVGGIIGQIGFNDGGFSGQASRVLNTGAVSGENNVGGICGANCGTSFIEASINEGTVTASTGNVGGLSGWASGLQGGSLNRGTVNGTAADYTGGLVGYCEGPIVGCYNIGPVNGKTGTAGALCGYMHFQLIMGYYKADGLDAIGVEGEHAEKVIMAYAFGDGTNNTGWPSEDPNRYWGLADADYGGVTTGKYWKTLGSWNDGNPQYPELAW